MAPRGRALTIPMATSRIQIPLRGILESKAVSMLLTWHRSPARYAHSVSSYPQACSQCLRDCRGRGVGRTERLPQLLYDCWRSVRASQSSHQQRRLYAAGHKSHSSMLPALGHFSGGATWLHMRREAMMPLGTACQLLLRSASPRKRQTAACALRGALRNLHYVVRGCAE
jgi:hypothetical protein